MEKVDLAAMAVLANAHHRVPANAHAAAPAHAELKASIFRPVVIIVAKTNALEVAKELVNHQQDKL